MKIIPNSLKSSRIFYNNLCLIAAVFCVAFFIKAGTFKGDAVKWERIDFQGSSAVYGPIEVGSENRIYQIKVNFSGSNSELYISGEVLDKNEDPLYEFGKALWEENGYDDEGSWSEKDNAMETFLTFGEKGTYYIKLDLEDGTSENAAAQTEQTGESSALKQRTAENISVQIGRMDGSYVAPLKSGTLLMIIILFVFIAFNFVWLDSISRPVWDLLKDLADD